MKFGLLHTKKKYFPPPPPPLHSKILATSFYLTILDNNAAISWLQKGIIALDTEPKYLHYTEQAMENNF